MRPFVYLPADVQHDAPTVAAAPLGGVIIDLEDGVSPDRKVEARAALRALVDRLRGAAPLLLVRINSPDTAEGAADLQIVGELPADVRLLVPKPVTPETLRSALEAGGARRLWCMAEEADLADRLEYLLAGTPGLEGVVFGSKDMLESLGLPFDLDRPELPEASARIQQRASALGLRFVDGIAVGRNRIASATRRARGAGYDGITLARLSDAFVAAAAIASPPTPSTIAG